jgi:hypothetical protein
MLTKVGVSWTTAAVGMAVLGGIWAWVAWVVCRWGGGLKCKGGVRRRRGWAREREVTMKGEATLKKEGVGRGVQMTALRVVLEKREVTMG